MERNRLAATWFVQPALAALAANRGDGPAVDGLAAGSSDEQFDSLAAGTVDVAVTAMDNVFGWNRQRSANRFGIIAQIEATTRISLVARAGIASLSDLAGQPLLVDSATNGFVTVLRAMLMDAGVAIADSQLVPVGGVASRFDRLVAGQGAATLLGPPFTQRAIAAGLVERANVDVCYPGFPGQGIVIDRNLESSRRVAVEAWLRSLEAALGEANGADAKMRLADIYGPAADTMRATLPRCLTPDPAGIALLIGQRSRLGLPGGDDRLEDLVDTSFLPPVAPAASVCKDNR